MKTRNGFVSNSSSSSFVIRKSDVDVKDLKLFLLDSKSIYTLIDENDYRDEMDQHNDHYLHTCYWLSTHSGDEDYVLDHIKMLQFLHTRGIEEVTGQMGSYEGDGRFSKDEEDQVIEFLKKNGGNIQKTFEDVLGILP